MMIPIFFSPGYTQRARSPTKNPMSSVQRMCMGTSAAGA